MKKRISISDLKPGMRIMGLDQSWLRSSLGFHRQVMKTEEDIAALRRSGVREVDIDGGETLPEIQDSPRQSPAPFSDSPSQSGLVPLMESGLPHGFDNPPTESVRVSGSCSSVADEFHEKIVVARRIRLQAISAVEQFFEGIKAGVELKAGCLEPVTQSLLSSLRDHEGSMLAEIQLQRMKNFNASLFAHSVDVCVMALLVGNRSQLAGDELRILALGSLLNDVGQLRLPRNLLTRRHTLTLGEQELYQSHPTLGAIIISESEGIPEGARRIVSEHHERINGTGFPWKRSGVAIFLLRN